nr:DEAD-box ATP-dependent RNA helicase 42-like [Arachis hypogaea]
MGSVTLRGSPNLPKPCLRGSERRPFDRERRTTLDSDLSDDYRHRRRSPSYDSYDRSRDRSRDRHQPESSERRSPKRVTTNEGHPNGDALPKNFGRQNGGLFHNRDRRNGDWRRCFDSESDEELKGLPFEGRENNNDSSDKEIKHYEKSKSKSNSESSSESELESDVSRSRRKRRKSSGSKRSRRKSNSDNESDESESESDDLISRRKRRRSSKSKGRRRRRRRRKVDSDVESEESDIGSTIGDESEVEISDDLLIITTNDPLSHLIDFAYSNL